MAALRKKVQSRLDALAAPGNEYVFDLAGMTAEQEDDEDGEEVGEGDGAVEKMDVVEDAEEEQKRLEKEGRIKLARAKRRALSSAARRQLPLPEETWVNSAAFPAALRPLLERDFIVQSCSHSARALVGRRSVAESLEKVIEEYPELRFLGKARALVKAEVEANTGTVSVDDFVAALEKMESQAEEWVLRENGEIVEAGTDDDRVRVLAAREKHAAEAQKAQHKMMKRLELVSKGFQRRLSLAENAVGEEWDKLVEVQQQIACVTALEEKEKEALPRRIAEWEDAVREQKEKHMELQREYAALTGK